MPTRDADMGLGILGPATDTRDWRSIGAEAQRTTVLKMVLRDALSRKRPLKFHIYIKDRGRGKRLRLPSCLQIENASD
jgi:hypothetical protein